MFGRLLLVLSCVLFSVTAQAETVIGYVNLQRAILEVNEGKRARETLKAAFEKRKVAIKAEEQQLIKLRDEIRKQAAVKTDAAFRERAMEFEKKSLALREKLMQEQQELQKLEKTELDKITQKMRGIIEKIGKAGKYTLILEVQDARLLYAKPHLDLTNELIRKFNTKFP